MSATKPTKTPEQYQASLRLPYLPSSYQCAIFDWVTHGRGNAVVEAVAGSGKSTTVELTCRLLTSTALVVAFNKSVEREMSKRLQGTRGICKTVHGTGFAAVRFNVEGKVDVDKYKYWNLMDDWSAKLTSGTTPFGELTPEEQDVLLQTGRRNKLELPCPIIMRVFDLARLNLVDFDGDGYPECLWDLVNHHNLDVPAGLDRIIRIACAELARLGRDLPNLVDFTDMVWLPVVNGYKPKTYSWVFVDECQDISAAHLALLRKCVKRGGRMLFVGDRRQAIYGFAGADARSFENIIEQAKATLLPLSVCYRCPTKVLDLAREHCPQIEARPDAPEGTVRRLEYDNLVGSVREGDMILCRRNAPLVSVCFALIADGIAAQIKGRDIGVGIQKAIEKIGKGGRFEDFPRLLGDWLSKEHATITRRGGRDSVIANRLQGLEDKAECIRIIYARSTATTIKGLKDDVAALFSDDRPSVQLSSIHRAKGLENARVMVLGDTELSFPGMQSWQREQERNLTYVAYTRAQEELVFVNLPE